MKDKLFSTIDSLNEEYITFWQDVCNIESPTDCKEGIDKVSSYFANKALAKGWQVETIPFERAGDLVIITANASSNEAPISFSGHLDTVHPIGMFGYPPVKIEGDKIYGPGVTDCKGGVVAGFMAMDALIKCGYTKRPLQLLLQVDEEHSMSKKQTIKTIGEKAKNAVAFFNLEGGDYGEICLQRKGISTFTFRITGIEAHSSKCATEGASAIREAAYKILELEKFKDADGITCSCGVIKGGTVSNTVPGYCEFRANFRYWSMDEYAVVENFCTELAKKVFVQGCVTEVERTGHRVAMFDSPLNRELLRKMNDIFVKNGLPALTPVKKMGASDAADITSYGIPCVECVGVVGGKIHSIGEYAEIKSLTHSAKLLAIATSEL